MRKEYKVEILVSYDKHYEDSETLAFHIYLDEEETKNEMQKEDAAIREAFKKVEVLVKSGVYHALEIKSLEEVKR